MCNREQIVALLGLQNKLSMRFSTKNEQTTFCNLSNIHYILKILFLPLQHDHPS
jgi:hypothetical protein